jgi:type IV secretion system protein VirB4
MDTIKMSLAIDSHIKIDQNSENNYIDANNAKSLNESGEVKFGFYTSTVIITADNLNQVEQNARQIRNIFRTLGFQSQIERHHSMEAFLGSMPGYSYANVRKWLIHSLNLADIMPSTSIWSGLTHNPCSFYRENNPPLFYARTTGHTPIRISLHVEDNGHTLILGPTGSGKSTLLNFIIAQHFRYKNARVFVFDKDKSSLPLCYSCNGEFYDIGEINNQVYFQPLSNLESDLDFDFAGEWLEELCRLNGLNEKFTDNHRRAIRHALTLMQKETSIDRRTISYFRHLVQDYNREIADILDRFSQEKRELDGGTNAGFINKIFDANNDLIRVHKAKLTVFEMSKLMELGDSVVIPALRYLIHVVSKQFDSCEPTLMIFDESFLFFKHPLFREKIIEWIKTMRKFNVAIIFATTEIADLFKYDDLRSALKTNCATKIFLPNRRALSEDIAVQYQSMGINTKQIELIAHGVKGEYFYMSDLGTRKFTLDLYKDQATFAYVAKTSREDVKKAIELKSKNLTEDFAYSWLKECNIGRDKQQLWQCYFEDVSAQNGLRGDA